MLFDSVFCYFPITFRPPPNDPYGITALDLKSRLRQCIAATGLFAPYAFPQLIDKLDDTSPHVKKDVMQTIGACASSYGVTTVSNYSITLWDSLKFEILNVQEDDLAGEALKSLQSIAICLSSGCDLTDSGSPLANYLRPIIRECNDRLQEPTHKQARPAGQILGALGTTSPVSFARIVRDVLPPLETLYQNADSIAKQRALLEVILRILDSAIAVYGAPNTPAPPVPVENPLEPFKDRLFELSIRALMSTATEEISFRITALRVLLRLCMVRNFLQKDEIGMFVQYLDEILLEDDANGRNDLRREAIQALVEISKFKPNLIMEITLPAFMARLPESCISDDRGHLVILEGLAQLSKDSFVSDTLVRRLLNKLDVVLRNGGSHAYPQAILLAIHYILSQRELSHNPNLDTYHGKIVVGLISQVVLASTGQEPVTALNDIVTLEILGRLVLMIVQALDEHKQKSVSSHIYSLFTDETNFTPILFRIGAPPLERSTMVLSTSLMAGVNSKAAPRFPEEGDASWHRLLPQLVKLALSEDVPSTRQAILRQVGLLTNKFLPYGKVQYAMDILVDLVTGLLEATIFSENAVQAVFWIAKALVLRLCNTDEVLEKLLLMLTNGKWSLPSARGFALLLAPDEILCKENGATIRLLAKQKVFNVCVPTISQQFRNAATTIKPNFLIALSGILKFIPTEIILPDIDTLLPLLLQSLDLEDLNVKAATIQSLATISQESPKAVEGYIGSLVTRLLKSANSGLTDSTSVRHNALQCLRLFPGKVKDSNLLPYRNAVTRGLMKVLDDPKRHIRKAAVECRAAWINMDEPQSD